MRRVATAAWQTAKAQLDLWIAPNHAPEPAPPRAVGDAASPSSASTLPTRTTAAMWTEHACDHVDRWLRRLAAADGPSDARSVRHRRTALRRLRLILRVTAITSVEDAEETQEAWRNADRSLRRLTRRLGAVRDHDVALGLVAARRDASTSELECAALEELAGRIGRRRQRAWDYAARRLDDDALREAVESVRLCVAAAVTQGSPDALARRWWHAAHAQLAQALDATDDDLIERLHAIRIAAREIRYGLELFDDTAPPAAAVLLLPCIAAQQAIGAHRDLAGFHTALTARGARASRRGRVALARGLESAVVATAVRCDEARQRATSGFAQLRALVSATAPVGFD